MVSWYCGICCLPRLTYKVIAKTAPAITAEVIVIVRGDQNPLFAVTGGFVGPDSLGVPSDVPGGGRDGPWVTVNIAVTTPMVLVAVTV